MILHFFQTCIENSSHIPYFELFKKSVFIFCARAYMQMQNWTKIYRCNVEKFALKTGIFFTKKKKFLHILFRNKRFVLNKMFHRLGYSYREKVKLHKMKNKKKLYRFSYTYFEVFRWNIF